jgi:hypothetical protein
LDATQWNVSLIVIIGTLTKTQSLSVTWVDPCTATTFVPLPIANSFGLISSPVIVVNVHLPWLNDRANVANGGSTTSSICGIQSFAITENGLPPAYLTTSFDAASGQNVMKFATTNALMAGSHVITVNYSLNLYSAVATSTFTFVFYELLIPIPPGTTTYKVSSPTLKILTNSY